jgi:UDP-N-acetylmuramate dehydrogenase
MEAAEAVSQERKMGPFSGFEKIVRQAEPLAMHTWFQLGGPAEYFAEPTSADQVVALVRRCHEYQVPLHLLGGGSNILVRDEGVPGLVLQLTAPAFCEIRTGKSTMTVGAGQLLGRVVTSAAHAGLAGLEVLVAIPGTVGGALRDNAGSRGEDIGQWTSEVTIITRSGEVVVRDRDDLEFGYRQSNLDEPVILSAVFELEQEDPRELARRLQKHWILRKSSHPMGHQCAGCVFKDPRGVAAGALIEQAGLKGTRIGGAVVSDRHANFIVAEPEATSSDVLRLIDMIRSQVHDRLGVELELALEIW